MDIIERFKQVMGKPVVAHRSVIVLKIGILSRLARLNKRNVNAALGRPSQHHGADLIGAIITANDSGFAISFDDPVEGTDDAFGRQ